MKSEFTKSKFRIEGNFESEVDMEVQLMTVEGLTNLFLQ